MSSPPTDETLEHIYRRAHEIKKRRRWFLAVPLILALVVALAVPTIWNAGDDDSSHVVTDDGTEPRLPPPPPGSVFYAVGLGPNGPALQQIDSTTTAVLMTYPIPALPGEDSESQGFTMPDSLRLSADGSVLYFRRVSGTCGGPIYAVDVDDPSTMRVVFEPPANTTVGDFVPTSDGRIVWYRCSNDFTEGSIVVTDPAIGSEHTINSDPRWGTVGLSVSPDDQTLAVAIYAGGILPAEVRLVAIDASSPTAVQDAQPLQPTAGCGFDLPRFNPATGELYLIENCGPFLGQGGQLIARNLETETSRQLFVVGDDTALVDYSIDATGRHLLYSVSKAMNPTGSVGDGAQPATFRMDDGQIPVEIPLPMLVGGMPGSRAGPNLVW